MQNRPVALIALATSLAAAAIPAQSQQAVPAPTVSGTQQRGTSGDGTLAQVAAQEKAANAPQPVPEFDLTTHAPPAIENAPQGKMGDAIRLGARLFNETFAVVGPDVADPAMRYSGNNLACTNCHEQGGTKPYSMPMMGITGQFPQYRPRGDRVATLQDRINGCMQRSMNGKPLPVDSAEMTAFVAYMQYISQGIPAGARLKGAGLPEIEPPARAADPKAGAVIYGEVCVACHGENGLGLRAEEGDPAKGYEFPPLAGDDSFNDGAGMFRLLKATAFIHGNMPQGTTWDSPSLTVDQAYDVAAYVETLPRPHKTGQENDYPDLSKKPVDAPEPPFADDFPAEQHKFGPFGPIQAAQKRK